MLPKLGIIAGGGALPGIVAQTVKEQGRASVLLALRDHADPDIVTSHDPHWLDLWDVPGALEIFRNESVEEIVLTGTVRRPSADTLPQNGNAHHLMKRRDLRLGDGSLLKLVIRLFEEHGAGRIVGVDEIVHSLLAPAGVLTERGPDEEQREDIHHGASILDALGSFEFGQSIVVQQGMVLGLEAVEGTDALIRRCGSLKRSGPGPILVKIRYPDQDRRADLPTVGTTTVQLCVESGFSGIVIEAGESLIVEREKTIALANRNGLFLEGCHLVDR